MLKNYRYPLVLLTALFCISSCCKKRLYCDSGSLDVAFVGFKRADVMTIQIKRFKIGDRSKALDSSVFLYTANNPVVPNKRDTLYLSDYTSNTGMSNRLTWGNEWEIRIPALERYHTFKDLNDAGNRYQIIGCGDDATRCTNEIANVVLDDQWIGTNKIFLRW